VVLEAFGGNSVIVSGGAGGLGEATVRRLHADGLAVVIADLAQDKGKALAEELGEGAVFASSDVTDEGSVLSAIDSARQLGTFRYAVVVHGGGGVAQRVVQRDGSPADLDGFITATFLLSNRYVNGEVLRLDGAQRFQPR
jgi:NADP-dependent 3-hydroxy acid dehydrogenase YdfG